MDSILFNCYFEDISLTSEVYLRDERAHSLSVLLEYYKQTFVFLLKMYNRVPRCEIVLWSVKDPAPKIRGSYIIFFIKAINWFMLTH